MMKRIMSIGIAIILAISLFAFTACDFGDIMGLQRQIDGLNNKIIELEQGIAEKDSRIAELEAEILEYKSLIKEQADKIAELEAEILENKSLIKEQADKIAELEAENKALRDRITELEETFPYEGTEGLAFNLINDGKAYEVSAGTATELGHTEIVIPNSYKGKPVTAIAERGLWEYYNDINGSARITSIVIPLSVTSIGEWAFAHCVKLENLEIPPSVTNINRGAFYGCRSLTSIVIPDGVTALENGLFESCWSLKSIVIPASVTRFGFPAMGGGTSVFRLLFAQRYIF